MLAAGFIALVACGPSAEEKAAADKHNQDSIDAAMHANDAAMEQQAMQDSANKMVDTTTVTPAEQPK